MCESRMMMKVYHAKKFDFEGSEDNNPRNKRGLPQEILNITMRSAVDNNLNYEIQIITLC